jgi:hypothetical protein
MSHVCGQYGIIHALLPYTFAFPAYGVVFDGRLVALSEQSLEKVESQDSDAV